MASACERITIVRNDGDRVIISAMDTHASCVIIQEHACKVLTKLSISDGNKVTHLKGGSFKGVIGKIQQRTSKIYKNSNLDTWSAMTYLFSHVPDIKSHILLEGGIKSVLVAM